MGLPAVALLELLEKATGWGYCCYCCHLGSRCICMGAYSPAPPPSWSQVVDQSPGYGAPSGGMTTPSTTAAGMSGYVPPPTGLPPIDFSNWRLLSPEAPASRGLPTAPLSLPGVRRSINLKGMAKRIVGEQMAQCPGSLAQWMPAPATSTPCAPQMTPPLHQPPPGWPATSVPCTPQTLPPLHRPPPGWLATLYQQVVQPPKKPTGRGVTADAPTDKTTPVFGASPQDRGRSNMRGWGGSSRSVSCPRGMQEKASAQPLCQEGDLPSRSIPSVPPPLAPEGTQPQQEGRRRSTLRDPAWLVVNFRNSGWRKDLEHILWVYYKFSVASFREAEWVRVKERFFNHFLQYKDEALALKEAHPMDFMAYIQDHFHQATSLHLDGLGSFTGWIKWGSYYHGLVARQGCLHKCLHLTGAPLARWPQVAPSKSRWESQMKSDTQIPSSSRPSVGATVAPITETPVVAVPVAEAPVAETPLWRHLLMRPLVLKLQLPPPPHLLPWRQAEWAMANRGQIRWRPAKMMRSRGVGPQSMPGCNRGGRNQNHRFPSLSGTARGGSPLSHNSMRMWQSSPSLTTTWLVVR